MLLKRVMLSRVCEMFLHSSVCLSVCPSVRPIQPLHAAATGLLLWAWQPGYIYRSWRGWQVDGQQQAQCSGVPHPDAGITTLSADMGSWTPESCSLLFQQNIGGTVIAPPLIAEWSTLVTLCPRIYFWNYVIFTSFKMDVNAIYLHRSYYNVMYFRFHVWHHVSRPGIGDAIVTRWGVAQIYDRGIYSDWFTRRQHWTRGRVWYLGLCCWQLGLSSWTSKQQILQSTGRAACITPRSRKLQDSATSMISSWLFWNCWSESRYAVCYRDTTSHRVCKPA